MKAFVLLFTFLAAPLFLAVAADDLPLSPGQMQQVREELRSRNITEEELNQRLLQKGVNLEEIPPEELPAYQAIIMDTVNELEAEKRAAQAEEREETTDTPSIASPAIVRPATPTIEQEIVRPPVVEEPSLEQEPILEEETRMIYGHEPFASQEINVFRTTEGARAPDTYILGPGDQIRITIFGDSQADLLLEINSSGYIQPSETPQIYLKGLTIAQARSLLTQRLSQFYSFRPDQFALTIQTARTITVNVFGESRQRGSFTMSALNTAFNALAAAGGPTEIGSVRNIRHIRGNEVKILDVYAFMHNPSIQFEYDLQHNDIIYIPVSEKVVRITGAVKRPKRYELTQGETLRNLIEYAGGINYDTYPDFLQIERVEDGERTLREWSLSEALRPGAGIVLQDGDIVRLRQIEKPLEQYVEVEGAVFYDGRYDLRQNPTLNILLERAMVRPQAKTDLIFVERILTDESVRIIPVRWDEISHRGEVFVLEPRDNVRIFDQQRYRDIATLRISGDVRNDIERTLQFDERIRLEDALSLAGGANPTAADTAIVVRRNLFNPSEIDVIRVNLTEEPNFLLQPGDALTVYDIQRYTDTERIRVDGNVRNPTEIGLQYGQTIKLADVLLMAGGLAPTATDIGYVIRMDLSNPDFLEHIAVHLHNEPDFPLQAGDQLYVYNRQTYTNVPQLSIQGAVNNPFTTSYSQELTISDLLKMAGGFTETAALNRVDVFRLRLSQTQGTRFDLISIEVDSSFALTQPYEHFYLRPYDQIAVRQIPMFDPNRSIQISGEVMYPGNYPLETRRVRLSELIKDAGGLTEQADPRHATLIRSYEGTGPVGIDLHKALSRRRVDRFDPIILPGDVITIPHDHNVVSIRIEATRLGELERRDLIVDTDVVPGTQDEVITFVYQGPQSARWYIENFAGGFAPDADKRSVTVTMRNGQVKGTKRRMLVFNNYPTVKPGSTIALTYEPPEDPAEERERVDWDRVYARTMTGVTTLLSLIVLLDRVSN